MLDKMSVDSFNPVISALIHKMPSSNFRIFEIINAIEFSKKWAPQHFNQMANTKNDTERFFPYLFESEIKTLLRHNGFLIKKEKKDEIQKYDAVMAHGSQRSEERRVGKEWRSRRVREQYKEKGERNDVDRRVD